MFRPRARARVPRPRSAPHSAKAGHRREAELRQAIRDDQLSLSYQPVVDPGGEVALVRWNHLGRELAPAEFLPVAERGHLLVDLDRWVLRTALTEAPPGFPTAPTGLPPSR